MTRVDCVSAEKFSSWQHDFWEIVSDIQSNLFWKFMSDTTALRINFCHSADHALNCLKRDRSNCKTENEPRMSSTSNTFHTHVNLWDYPRWKKVSNWSITLFLAEMLIVIPVSTITNVNTSSLTHLLTYSLTYIFCFHYINTSTIVSLFRHQRFSPLLAPNL